MIVSLIRSRSINKWLTLLYEGIDKQFLSYDVHYELSSHTMFTDIKCSISINENELRTILDAPFLLGSSSVSQFKRLGQPNLANIIK